MAALQDALDVSFRADFCVGHFNLRGWRGLAPFIDRWDDRLCVDVTNALLKIIEDSGARESLIPPYHLSHETRVGLTEFKIPKVFGDRL